MHLSSTVPDLTELRTLLGELRLRYEALGTDLTDLGARVDGAALCAAVVRDIASAAELLPRHGRSPLMRAWPEPEEDEASPAPSPGTNSFHEKCRRQHRLTKVRGASLESRRSDRTRVAKPGTQVYDPVADARSVAARLRARGGGQNG